MPSGKKHAALAASRNERLATYQFLGFVCYWDKSRSGSWRLKYKSRSDRLTRTLNELKQYLRDNISQDTNLVLKRVKRVVKGWTNYHAISDNRRTVSCFILLSKRAVFSWLNRRGGKRKINWSKFTKFLQRIEYPEKFKTVSMFTS